jgi:hypothetical protein
LTPTLLDKLFSKLPITCAWQYDGALPKTQTTKTTATVVIELKHFRIANYLQPVGQVTYIRRRYYRPIPRFIGADKV